MKISNKQELTILILLAIILILFSVTKASAQSGKLDEVYMYASFTQDKMIHPIQDDEYRIHSDNVYQIGWGKNLWRVAMYRSGHEHKFFWSNPTYVKDGKQVRNRNGSGIYFQHPIPWLSNHMECLNLSVGYRFKIFGDPITDEAGIDSKFFNWMSSRLIPVLNIGVPVYRSDKKLSINLDGYITSRYRCATVGIGGSITF